MAEKRQRINVNIYRASHNAEESQYIFDVEEELKSAFDYVKVGPYIEALGPLNEKTTNQRLYRRGEDITPRFWRKK